MKTIRSYYVTIGLMALFASCKGGSGDYDASGVFETTEVTVSARGTGEIMRFDIEEGYQVEAGQAVGYIDTRRLPRKSVSGYATRIWYARKRRIKSSWTISTPGSPYSRSGSRRRWRLWRTATGA